jgi:hypothetical protein
MEGAEPPYQSCRYNPVWHKSLPSWRTRKCAGAYAEAHFWVVREVGDAGPFICSEMRQTAS